MSSIRLRSHSALILVGGVVVAAMIGIVSCAPGDSPLPQSDSAGLPSATSTPAPVSPTVQPSPTNTPTALASPTSRPTATPSQAPTDTPTLAATASPTSDGPAREYGDSFRNRDLVTRTRRPPRRRPRLRRRSRHQRRNRQRLPLQFPCHRPPPLHPFHHQPQRLRLRRLRFRPLYPWRTVRSVSQGTCYRCSCRAARCVTGVRRICFLIRTAV